MMKVAMVMVVAVLAFQAASAQDLDLGNCTALDTFLNSYTFTGTDCSLITLFAAVTTGTGISNWCSTSGSCYANSRALYNAINGQTELGCLVITGLVNSACTFDSVNNLYCGAVTVNPTYTSCSGTFSCCLDQPTSIYPFNNSEICALAEQTAPPATTGCQASALSTSAAGTLMDSARFIMIAIFCIIAAVAIMV